MFWGDVKYQPLVFRMIQNCKVYRFEGLNPLNCEKKFELIKCDVVALTEFYSAAKLIRKSGNLPS